MQLFYCFELWNNLKNFNSMFNTSWPKCFWVSVFVCKHQNKFSFLLWEEIFVLLFAFTIVYFFILEILYLYIKTHNSNNVFFFKKFNFIRIIKVLCLDDLGNFYVKWCGICGVIIVVSPVASASICSIIINIWTPSLMEI